MTSNFVRQFANASHDKLKHIGHFGAYRTFKIMPINESDIEKVAQLAHLELAPEELKIFVPQITEIVSYIEQLNQLDTSNVEPALGGLTPEGQATDSIRNDEIAGSLGQQKALAEAPDPAAGHFRVPKVL